MSRLWCVVALLTSGLSAAAATSSFAQRPLAIRNVSVLAADGTSMLDDHTVLVRDQTVAAVGPADEVKVPRRAEIIDGTGRYLIPGLTDLHVHIRRSRADTEKLYALFLRHGVTTVLNLDGGSSVLKDRQRSAAGEIVAPTIYSTGGIIRGSEGMSHADGVALAQRQVDAGYDLLKVYNAIPAEAYRGIVETAKEAGVPLIGHAVRSVGLEGALDNGQHIAHMEEVVYGWFTWGPRVEGLELPEDRAARLEMLLDAAQIPDLARRVADSGIFVTPNLTAYHHIGGQLDDLEAMLARPDVELMPESMTRSWQRDRNGYFQRSNPERFRESLRQTFPFLQQLTAGFHAAGVPLLAGTDVGIPVILAGSSLHDELLELVDAGLQPAAALATATSTAARFLGRDDAGTIEAGSVADLVLLRADPLEDINNVRQVERVVLRGRLLDAAR